MSCIFCGNDATDGTVAHIFPRSLGGGDWAVLPRGLECAACNQFFGSKIEPLALGSFPLLPFRLMMQIPTGKGKAPKIGSHLGTLRATGVAGRIGLDPTTSDIERAVHEGIITQVRVLAECTKPTATARLLLKMGLEVVARDSPDQARDLCYDAARVFARKPQKGTTWWFLIATDHTRLFDAFQRGVTREEWTERVAVEVLMEGEAEMCVLRLLDMTLMCPMHPNIMPPDMSLMPEPDFRLVSALV